MDTENVVVLEVVTVVLPLDIGLKLKFAEVLPVLKENPENPLKAEGLDSESPFSCKKNSRLERACSVKHSWNIGKHTG